jgi:transcriptional regulator with XRE-family HTH domain
MPMSAANLSRIENGEQGPPSDEIIGRLARILDTDAKELLVLAGRTTPATSSDTLLRELRQLRTEIRDGFARVEAALLHKP